jgi:N-hydroxyarylamine O-acetyltransferase
LRLVADVEQATPDRRYALLNNRLSTHHLRGESEQVTLATAHDLRETLEGVLNITLPEDAGLDAVLGRFVGR